MMHRTARPVARNYAMVAWLLCAITVTPIAAQSRRSGRGAGGDMPAYCSMVEVEKKRN